MPSVTNLIQIDRDQSVQVTPDTKNGTRPHTTLTLGTTMRGPLLPARGSRERERALKDFFWNDYNTLFRSAIAGLSKRVQSTPWELGGDDDMVEYFQFVLMQADFGRGWESFVSKLLLDYSRYDGGAYIELIGSGDPLGQLTGPVTGLGVLDSLRCYPTGDPLYPVIYYDIHGRMHVMHHSRVVRFVDMIDPSEWDLGYGECALARCISAVMREILMNRYVEQQLDDNPPPGLFVFKNLSDQQLQNAITQMEMERNTDSKGTWGKVVRLYGLQTETMPEVQSVPFNQPPDKFDFDQYKTLNVKEMALGIGVDIQDLWELTGGNIGSATQSEILHQKSKGKALGRILKGLERVLNQALPAAVEFEFKYRDPDEDQQEATKAQTWASVVTILASNLTPDEQRQLLANQVPGVRDVVTDEDGVMIRLDDADPKAPGQDGIVSAVPTVADESTTPDDEAVVGDTETKAYSDTQREFQQTFAQIIEYAQDGVLSQQAVAMAIRGQLQQAGERVYLDGLVEGGIENPVIDDEAAVAISAWRAQQNSYIQSFVGKLFESGATPQAASDRAQMWVNKSLNPLYYVALANADDQQMYMWVMDPIKEHCSTCLRMNGQIHPMEAYIESGYLPQSEVLECGGYRCGCKLVKAPGQRARGRIPSAGRSGLSGLFGRIAGAFRRLLGKSKALKYAWSEGDHPRDESGQFGSGGGGSGGGGDVSEDQEFKDTWKKNIESIKSEGPQGERTLKNANKYTDEGYIKVNEALRKPGESVLEGETIETIQDMDNLTNRRLLAQDIITHRKDDGAGLPKGGNLSDDEFLKLKGGAFKDPGFTSTSTGTHLNDTFGDYEYEFRVPKGSRGAYVNDVSKYPKEQEFVLGRNTKSKIVETQIDDNGRRKLILEVIPDG